MKLRQGRKVPRNLYVQLFEEPSDADLDVGRVDSILLAAFVCFTVNRYACANSWGQQEFQDAVADLLQRGRTV